MALAFSPAQPTVVVSAHAPASSSSSWLARKSLVLLWNIGQPDAPQKCVAWFCVSCAFAGALRSFSFCMIIICPLTSTRVMCCDGEPTSVCFSPVRGHLVIVGCREGSLALWDLREGSALHTMHTLCMLVCV